MNEILNSEQTAATDAAIPVQVAPFGEFPGVLRGGVGLLRAAAWGCCGRRQKFFSPRK